MSTELFGGDIVTRVHRNRADRSITFERVQSVDGILDDNKRLQGEAQSRKSDFRHVGTVPCVLVEQWLNEGAPVLRMSSHEFAKFIRRKLDDPAYAYLRTDNKAPTYVAGADL
jgi:hypothetical protein